MEHAEEEVTGKKKSILSQGGDKCKEVLNEDIVPKRKRAERDADQSDDDEGSGRNINAGWRRHMAQLAHEKSCRRIRERRAALRDRNLESFRPQSATSSQVKISSTRNEVAGFMPISRRTSSSIDGTRTRREAVSGTVGMETSTPPSFWPPPNSTAMNPQRHTAPLPTSETAHLQPLSTIIPRPPPSVPDPGPRGPPPPALPGYPLSSKYIATHPPPPNPEIFYPIVYDSRRPYIPSEDVSIYRATPPYDPRRMTPHRPADHRNISPSTTPRGPIVPPPRGYFSEIPVVGPRNRALPRPIDDSHTASTRTTIPLSRSSSSRGPVEQSGSLLLSEAGSRRTETSSVESQSRGRLAAGSLSRELPRSTESGR
ncbi:hypothetical protein J1614_008877 [Plenodomus biglobosus]|nr:hypothetical protein J1614_008877 [Plenodomus biglobosus]